MAVHIGSWGLPEFGITEKLSNIFGQGRTAQGGSNLMGSQTQTTLVPTSGTPGTSFVPSGTSGAYGVTSGYRQPTTGTTPTPSGTTGGTTGGTSGGTPTGTSGSYPQEQFQGGIDIDYDAMIAPALAELDKLIGPAESLFAEQGKGIDTNLALQEQQARNMATEGEQTAKTSEAQQKRMTESAIDESRRQFSEISQGLQSRYGGTTGTGSFAEAIAGGQTMRNIGGLRQSFQTVMENIQSTLSKVRTASQEAIMNAQNEAQQMKIAAQEQLNNTLMQIRSSKSELMANKVKYAQDAMTYYRQTLQEIEARNTAYKQQIYDRQIAAEQKLASAGQKVNDWTLQMVKFGSEQPEQSAWVNRATQQVTPVQMSGYNPYYAGTKETEEEEFYGIPK